MKLISVELNGYKRFHPKQTLHLNVKQVALLGPNEAGKSTILKAITTLNTRVPILETGPSQEITRGLVADQNHIAVSAKFELEENDFALLREVPGAQAIQQFAVHKHVKGKLSYEITPKLTRNFKLRENTFRELREFASRLEKSVNSLAYNPPEAIRQLITSVLKEITTDKTGDLEQELIDKLFQLSEMLIHEPPPEAIQLAENLLQVYESESEDHPNILARNILVTKIPDFVLFTDQDRNLPNAFDLNLVGAGNIPKAVRNLAQTAGLNLEALYEAAKNDDRGLVHTLISNANKSLKAGISNAWKQSDITVTLGENNLNLNILVTSAEKTSEAISERSDGLKQFIALFALISSTHTNDKDVILLIDEAETRLHYDAQSNLVQMLSKQTFARKVIYTTHSFGCLPEDLGVGVRLVQPTSDGRHSTIENKFWSEGLGLTPVLIGIGAASMAFLPLRFCVLTEGVSDMILLPSILREATNMETLGFQISSGISEASRQKISLLNHEGSRTLFLVDGDTGGENLRKKLLAAAIPEKMIISLADVRENIAAIEDFISPELYFLAIDKILSSQSQSKPLAPADVGTFNRSRCVKEWCKTHSIQEPSKANVAYQILESGNGKIVDQSRKEAACNLFEAVKKRLAE